MIFYEKIKNIDVKSLSSKEFFVFFTIIVDIHLYTMMLFIQNKLNSSFLEFSEKYLNREEDEKIKEWISKFISSIINIQYYSEYDYFFVDSCLRLKINPDLDLPSMEEIKQIVLEQSDEKREQMLDDMLQEYVFSPMTTKRAKHILESNPTSIQ